MRLQNDRSAPVDVSSPLQLTGCQFWYRADKGVTMDANNRVSAWANQGVGTGFQTGLTQSTAGKQPLYRAVGIGGQPDFYFDGARFLSASFGSNDLAQPGHVWVVAQPTAASNIYLIDSPTTGKRWQFLQEAAAKDGFTASCGANLKGGIYSTVTPQIWSYEVNGASGRIWQDGALVKSGDVGSQVLNGLRIGASYQDSLYFTGYVAEVILFDRVLLAAERIALQRCLGTRYAITVP